MLANYVRRCLSFLLALTMVFSLVPAQAFATGEDGHDHAHEGDTPATEAAVLIASEEGEDIHVHSYESVTTPPTCGAKGYTTLTCACGDVQTTDEVAATGEHTYESKVVDPTTEAEGYTQYTCSVCGDTYKDNFVEKLAPVEEGPSALALDLTARVNAIVAEYGIKADMTEDDVFEAMYEKSDDELFATMDEMEALAEASEAATKEDEEYIRANADLQAYGLLCDAFNQLSEIALFAATGTHTPVEGVTVSVSGATDNSMSNGAVTVTAKGSGGLWGIGASAKTATITIYNESASTSTIAFDYTTSSVKELKIDGNVYSGNGTFSKVLEAGASFTVTITTDKNSTTNKLVMSNFSLTVAATESNVTVNYDSALGSVTIDGEAVAAGSAKMVSVSGGTLAATAASGAKFLGWITEDNSIIDKNASFTYKPSSDVTLTAVFAKDGGAPWFSMGAATKQTQDWGILGSDITYYQASINYLFDDLDAATAKAAADASYKTIVLMNSATLTGNHTIPAGVTLLVPFDDNNTMYLDQAVSFGEGASYVQPTAYRTLTLADGASLTVNGAVSVSGQHYIAQGGAYHGIAPGGPQGFVQMQGSSAITVNSGGTLYAYGYVTGDHSAKVEIKSGGKVYELFQVADYRGGDGTTNLGSTNKSQGIFPLNQYFVQNVEIPMYIYSGAMEYSYATIYASGVYSSSVAFIGSDGMFKLTSGYAVKYYDRNRDRMVVEAYGDMSISPISMKIGGDILGTNIDTVNFMLPIHSGVTVNVVSGNFSINQNIALLPGAEVTIGANASCTMGEGIKAVVYDSSTWGGYCSSINIKFATVKWSPIRKYTRIEADLVDASVVVEGNFDASKGYLYSTVDAEGNGGANITGVNGGVVKAQKGSDTVTKQATQATVDGNQQITIHEIAIQPVWLKNADGSYVHSETGTYNYIEGLWHKDCDGKTNENVTLEPNCTDKGKKDVSCSCGAANEKNVEIPALGHTPGAEATCTAPQTCTVCKAELAGAKGHTPGDAATCTAPQTCTVCKAELAEALGHKWDDATCTLPKTCSVCKATEGEALGHTPGDAATCTTPQICEVCKVELAPALNHDYEAVVTDPTCTAGGYTTYTCSRCPDSYVDNRVDALDHDWAATTYTWASATEPCTAERACKRNGCTETQTATATITSKVTVEPTCVTKQKTTYTATFDVEWADEQYKDIEGDYDTNAHTWGEATATWATDASECTAVRKCVNNPAHKQEATAEISSEITVEATCVTGQETTYYATFAEDWAKADPKVITGGINADAHKWGTEVTYTWSKDGKTCTASRVCEHNESHVDTVQGEMTSEVTTVATCVTPEVVTYTATFTGWAEAVKTNPVTGSINADAHDWDATTYTWESVDQPCTATRVCKHNGEHTETINATIKGIVTTEADCVTNEVKTYTATFNKDWAEAQTKTVTGEKNPDKHELVHDAREEPTCTEPGEAAGSHCANCDYAIEGSIIPAKGHKWGATVYTWNDDFSVCTATRTCGNDASHVETLDATVTVSTTEATCTDADVTTYTATFAETEDNWAETQTKSVTGSINADAHAWSAATYTWTNNGTVCEAKRTCQHDGKHTETAVVTMTQETTTVATCVTPEVITYTATFAEGWAETQTNAVTGKINADAHKWGENIAYNWSENGKTCTASRVCEYAETHVETAKAEMTSDVTTVATCVTPEVVTYTATFTGWAEAVKTNSITGEIDINAHDWNEGTAVWAEDGSSCTASRVCKNSAEHVENATARVTAKTTTATCTDPAVTTYTAVFAEGWAKADPLSITGTVDADAHSWNDTVYTWSEDGTVCAATRTCAHDASHVENATVTMTSKVKVQPTCVVEEVVTYTATFAEGWAKTQTNDVTGEVDADAHNWGKASYTWSEDGKTCTASRVCGYDKSHVETVTAVMTSEITTEATCVIPEVVTYTATFSADWAKTQTNDVTGEADADAHNWGAATYAWSEDGTVCTASRVCGHDKSHVETVTAVMTSEIATEATCVVAQVVTYTATFTEDWAETQTNDVTGETAADVHVNIVVDEAVAPTCHATGLTEGSHCGDCDTVLVAQTVVDQLQHEMLEATCTEPIRCKHGCGLTEGKPLGHTEVIDEEIPAFCTEDGLTEGKHCSVCGEVLIAQEIIPMKGHDIVTYEAKNPTYSNVGWDAYEECTRCPYTTYNEIPKLDVPPIEDYETFLENLSLLEELAYAYMLENPGKDPANLVIKYIRTGVDRYNSGSWGIMAGYEDAGFAEFVAAMEDQINAEAETEDQMLAVTSLKNIKNFDLPNGDHVDLGHMFGTMDITYHNNFGINHADVAGWAGDLVDLLSTVDRHNVTGTLDEMIADVSANYLCHAFPGESDLFSLEDMLGDLDGYYVMKELQGTSYETGTLTAIMRDYFTEDLTLEDRAAYFLQNRLGGVNLRSQIRDAVYNEYTGNKVIATLEGTREFNNTDLSDLRKASCYAFADYICKLAGDYVDVIENPYYTVFESEYSNLAPGITQEIKYATTADNKQFVYYVATADLTRDDVHVYANYNKNDPAAGWAMSRVLDQANAAQAKYGDPESELYIPNYNVIVSTNGDGYNMTTGEPGGLLVMNGVEYHAIDGNGFFGILKDGTPIIGTKADYERLKDQVQEGIGAFGTTLVKDGEVCISRTDSYYTDRAGRTAVGITKTGKVVLMVLDGRQEPFSCGGSMEEIAHIMREAGCVHAINLDGGGSTTYVAKQEGAEELAVVNRPSDGYARSVSTSLMMVSTAPNSTAFDHAILETGVDYMTVGAQVQITAKGVSATGNAAELPEDTTWAVSDTRWGSITEDGMFTALRNGSVEVYLMEGENVIGSKTLNVVFPDNVYFTKDNMDAIFGSKVDLPVKALYEGKEVAIQASDLKFSLSNETAGVIEGLSFTAAEDSGLKNVKVTAALANDENVSDSITIALYKQGETSFDFDQAVGGDRQMGWDRQVSNATTEDMITYDVIDPEKDMVTTYTFAIDMRQIPIPTQLSDLIYMLPGADAADASAWGFLMQLAERVSVLTEVKPVIEFDPNFDVDISELKLINDYFQLTNTEYDEATNKVTLTLNWIDQTAAIDPETANPLCLVSGIKLTPKADAAWTEQNTLAAVNAGQISYNVFLRANALYSFSLKEENQKAYGLKPFINPNDEGEKGGSFGSVYATFEDSYTLNKALKEGWVVVDGGYAYYVNGQRLTGICQVEGLYYDFGTNGINAGKTVYTGIFFDTEADAYRYCKLGVLTGGWNLINNEWYYFHASTMTAATGFETINGITFEFEENGKLVSGVWVETEAGTKYCYGPDYYTNGWKEIDGKGYYFSNGIRHTRLHNVKTYGNLIIWNWYNFGSDGIGVDVERNLHNLVDGIYYLINGEPGPVGLTKLGTDYYFVTSTGKVATGECYCWTTNCEIPVGTYQFDDYGRMINGFDENGKPLNGLVQKSDGIYYYINGMKGPAGLTKIGDDYYFVSSTGRVATGKYECWATNCDLPRGTYEFGADGKMLNGLVQKADGPYLYKNGNLVKTVGLTKVGSDYCYVTNTGKCVTGIYNVTITKCDLPRGTYEFGTDGRLIRNVDSGEVPAVKNGLVQEANGIYYYINGEYGPAGITKIGDDYYFVSSIGRVATGVYECWATNCEIPCGTYEFGPDGKMLNPPVDKPVEPDEPDVPVDPEEPTVKNGLVQEANGIYYYINGEYGPAGITKIGDYYYFVSSIGRVATGTYTCWATNCEIPCGVYEFDSQGRMLNPPVVEPDAPVEPDEPDVPDEPTEPSEPDVPVDPEQPVIKNGLVQEANGIYYYINGEYGPAGITKIGDYYYFVSSIGRVATGVYECWATNCEIPRGTYEFDSQGRMLNPPVDPTVKNGLVQEENGIYYYINGEYGPAGITKINGNYYFVSSIGRVATGVYECWATNCELPRGIYEFDSQGRMLNGLIQKDDGIYYYVNGNIGPAGLTKIGGEYYFVSSDGKVVTGEYYCWATNCDLPVGTYTFGTDGKMLKA